MANDTDIGVHIVICIGIGSDMRRRWKNGK